MAEDALDSGFFKPSFGQQISGTRLLSIAVAASLVIHLGLLLSSMGWRIIGIDNSAKAPDGTVLIATLAPKAVPSAATLPTLPTPAPAVTAAKPKPAVKPVVKPIVAPIVDDSNDAGLQPIPTLGALPELMPVVPMLSKPPEQVLADSDKLDVSPPNKVEPVALIAQGETNYTPRLDATPGTIDIRYKVSSSVVDGTARYQFSRDKNNKYEIESVIEASGFFASIFDGRMQQTSRGSISEQGLLPEYFNIQRGGGPGETATFDYASNKIMFNRRKGIVTEALPYRLQDIQSFLFQLGFDAPNLSTNPKSDASQLDVVATNARKIYRYQFKFIAQETLTLPFGKVETLHIKSAADDPTDVYDVWLAPAYSYLPVKLKFYAGKFALEQTAQSVTVTPFKP
jgi:Protein of unknown function (DUF3108)